MENQLRDHISLHVIRLSFPSISSIPELENFNPSDPVLSGDLHIPYDKLSTLPQNLENIYLGETSCWYLCVHNDHKELALPNFSVKVDVQTSSQRFGLPSLWSEATPIRALGPGEAKGQVLSLEVKELGQHIIVCTVHHCAGGSGTNSSPDPKQYFRKYTKFYANKPLDVRTKFFHTGGAESDSAYLEAQIQNTTTASMFMERVSLEPSDLYVATPVNAECADYGCEMAPGCCRQYLFSLRLKPNLVTAPRGVTSAGRLEMIWRSAVGEKGRLQTSQLQRVVPGYGDIRLTVISAPSVVKLKQMFAITCRVVNCSERTLDLFLVLDKTVLSGLVWSARSNRSLGKVEPGSSVDITLSLLPTCAGLQTISGVRLTDTCLKRTYEHDEIAQVFVYS